MTLTVGLLRELLRHLQAFQSLYENEGIDTIHCPGGDEISLWDLRYLYSKIHLLPARQAQAIELFLYEGKTERESAIRMGIAPSNPIGMYVTSGLTRLIELVEDDRLPMFRLDDPVAIGA